MLIRKPSLLFSAYSNLPSISQPTSVSSTSFKKRKREGTRQCAHCRREAQDYATIAGDSSSSHENDGRPQQQQEHEHAWPRPPQGQPHPTPYQIFAMKANGTYKKARFYELVKLYHPDRNPHPTDPVSSTVRMERYRLIVAANDILSDPAKRSAYDRIGAGWNGKAAVGNGSGGRDAHHPPGPFSQSWGGNADDRIWRNATWEDWERFHSWRAGGTTSSHTAAGVHHANRTGLYLSNAKFLLIVMGLALMGSTANYTRAQSEGQTFVDHRDVVHDRTAKELRKVKQEASGNRSRDDQIEWFVRHRDATMGAPGADSEALRQEKIDRVLPEREVCRSEEIVEKDRG